MFSSLSTSFLDTLKPARLKTKATFCFHTFPSSFPFTALPYRTRSARIIITVNWRNMVDDLAIRLGSIDLDRRMARRLRDEFIEISDDDDDDSVIFQGSAQRNAPIALLPVHRPPLHPRQPPAKRVRHEHVDVLIATDASLGGPPVKREPTEDHHRTSNPAQISTHTPRPPAPYYYDAELGCRMYRGFGYERFPIALGTVDEHLKICDDWDRGKVEHVDPDHSNQQTDGILEAVMEVLPDIEHEFVQQQISQLSQYNNMAEVTPALVISLALELQDYPRTQPKAKEKAPEPAADGTGVTVSARRDHLLHPHDYSRQAIVLLAHQFRHVPTCYISKWFSDAATRSLHEGYLHLSDIEAKYYVLHHSQRPYRRLRQPRQAIEKKYAVAWPPQGQSHLLMVNEIQAAKQKLEREAIKHTNDAKLADQEAANLEQHRLNKELIECQVCFDDEIPINRTVACDGENAHFFCYECVRQLANTQVGMMKHEMLCMHESGCQAELNANGVGKAIPRKIFDRLALNQQQADVAAAGIDGLEQCPHCEFKAVLDPVELLAVFQCFNPECRRTTCRKCHEDAHVPKSCEEVKKDRGLSARHQIEEARTKSMLRPCPKCKVKIVKDFGCNKMTCRCGCIICYVCKIDITRQGYNHFQGSGGGCPLHDDAGGIARRHDAEANEAERKAIAAARAENADLDEDQLRIETKAGDQEPVGQGAGQRGQAVERDVLPREWRRPPDQGALEQLRAMQQLHQQQQLHREQLERNQLHNQHWRHAHLMAHLRPDQQRPFVPDPNQGPAIQYDYAARAVGPVFGAANPPFHAFPGPPRIGPIPTANGAQGPRQPPVGDHLPPLGQFVDWIPPKPATPAVPAAPFMPNGHGPQREPANNAAARAPEMQRPNFGDDGLDLLNEFDFDAFLGEVAPPEQQVEHEQRMERWLNGINDWHVANDWRVGNNRR
jgi:hypothetical protein